MFNIINVTYDSVIDMFCKVSFFCFKSVLLTFCFYYTLYVSECLIPITMSSNEQEVVENMQQFMIPIPILCVNF